MASRSSAGATRHRDAGTLGRSASVEEDPYPLATLHDLLRSVGLLRLRHGVLTPTRAAGDDVAVVRRLRSAFDPDSFTTGIVELTIAALAQHVPGTSEDIAAHAYPLLGRGWQVNGRSLTESDVARSIAQQSALMKGLDLLDAGNRRV